MIEKLGFSQASNLETDYVTHLLWPRESTGRFSVNL
jgi:hypothetical protein